MVAGRRAVVIVVAVITAAVACSRGNRPTPIAEGDDKPTLSAELVTDGLTAHRPAVSGTNGLVTAGHPLASMAGVRILLQGGTAADAAVAILATLNLVEPMMSGAGGNGFMTVFDNASGQVYSLNATGSAPESLDAAGLTADELARGIMAGVTPGLFGGWIALLERFGTMSLGDVLQPAIEYAEAGHPLAPFVAESIAESRELFERFESTRRMLLPGGEPPRPGTVFPYPDLARTFNRVVEAEISALASGQTRETGLRAAFDRFYKGNIAREMARFYRDHGGPFTRADFSRFEPTWTEPVHTTYRGYDVYSSPVTSRGGLEVTMQLNLIEGVDIESHPHNSAQALHLIAESIKLAKADIYHFVADPTTTEVPVEGLLSKDYATVRRALVLSGRSMEYPDSGAPPGVLSSGAREDSPLAHVESARSYPGSTTSFTVVDRVGNVVVATPTLGSLWGTGVVVGETGLLFNNGLRHGSTSPYSDDVNYVAGGQVPVLNNSPTIVMKDGKFHLALGTPGGETIGQTQFQVLVNILDYGMRIQEAIEAPRIYLAADPNFYRPGAQITVQVEQRVAPQAIAELRSMGHTVELVAEYSMGNMQGILVDRDAGTMSAGGDPRRMMYAVGW